MYRFHRTARISRGKFAEALQWAAEVTGHINANYAPVSAQAHMEVFGQVGTIHWFTDYEDLASLEDFNMRLMADQGYWALLNRGAELFIEGSVHDRLTRSV